MKKDLKKVLIPFLLTSFLLGFLFLYKENIDFTQKINDSKLTNYFSIVGSLATVLAIYYAYKQIFVSNEPILYPMPLNLRIEEIDEKVDGFQRPDGEPFVKYKVGLIIDDKVKYHPFPAGTIKNIGNGIAKHVTVQWNYNKDKVANYIGSRYIYFKDDIVGPYPTHSYVKPEDVANINLPILMWGIYAKLFATKDLQFLLGEGDPELTLFIEYLDRFNNIHRKKFTATISPLPMDNIVRVTFNETKK